MTNFSSISGATTATPSFERPVDLVHLARQTLGDPLLEAEVLALFITQSRTVLLRIIDATQLGERRELAHTLKGSARAIGAWKVARAAEAVETLGADDEMLPHHIKQLADCVGEACLTIHALSERPRAA